MAAAAKVAEKAAPKYALIVQEVIDGKHDENLDVLGQAVAWRIKNLTTQKFRKGGEVRLIDHPGNKGWVGTVGVVDKINKKTIGVVVPCAACGRTKAMTEAEYDARYVPVGGKMDGPNGSVITKLKADEPICEKCYGVPAALNCHPSLLEAVA